MRPLGRRCRIQALLRRRAPKGALTTASRYNGWSIYSAKHGCFRVFRDALKGSTERKVHWTIPKKPDVAAWKKSLRLIDG